MTLPESTMILVRAMACGIVAFGVAAVPSTAAALCAVAPLEGDWVHDPAYGVIDELTIVHLCQDQVLNGVLSPPGDPFSLVVVGPGPGTRSIPYGSRAATFDGEWYVATFNLGWTTKTIYAHAAIEYPEKLLVFVLTDDAGPSVGVWDAGYMIRRASSCIDSCDGQAPTGCWCDAACNQFGDCCVDVENQCRPLPLDCGPYKIDCNGYCVDLGTDEQNCGDCGVVCGWGARYCDEGTCTDP